MIAIKLLSHIPPFNLIRAAGRHKAKLPGLLWVSGIVVFLERKYAPGTFVSLANQAKAALGQAGPHDATVVDAPLVEPTSLTTIRLLADAPA